MRKVAVLLLILSGTFAFAGIQPPRERERWGAVTVDEFTILGNASDRELRDVATRAVRLRDALALITSFRVRSPLPTRIYVFKDEAGFAPYRDAASGHVSENTAGLFVPRNEGNYVLMLTGRRDAASLVIQHELTHHFLRNTISGSVPLWFAEGLAEFYSTFETDGDAVKIGLTRDDHLALLHTEPLIHLDHLFTITERSPEYNEGSRRGVFYAESWALMHDLIIGNPQHHRQIGKFLGLIEAGKPSAEAFHAAFGVTDEEMERELRHYLKQYAFPYARFTSADLRNTKEAPIPATLPRDEELALLGDLLVHCGPAYQADAEAFLGEALRLNPKNAAATASLGLSKLLERRNSEANELYVRAVELGAREWLPYAIVADGLLDHSSPPAADVARARALYERAVAINPDAGHAYAGLGMTYLVGDGDPAAGIAALEKARQLDPDNLDAVANLALLYIRTNRRAEAMKLIDGPLADAADRRNRVQDALLLMDANAAIELVRQGKTTEGTGTLTKIVGEIHDPTIKAQIEEVLATVEASDVRQQQVREFNRAMSLALSRKWAEALYIVDRLLPEVKDPEMVAKIEAFRKQVAEAAKGRSK
jgi:tetratricopeptide (TPR) repeat protein